MKTLDDYATKYRNARIRREEGILEVLLHTGGRSLQWGELVRRDLCQLFADIAADAENRTVILSGVGADFCSEFEKSGWTDSATAAARDKNYWEGKHLLRNLADIEVPVIAAVNGRAHIHAELAVMCDIVLASDTASFRDPHYQHGRVPGDGVHIVWPLLLGLNRAKYFQLSGRIMTAQEARDLGVVAEVLPAEQVLDRAWVLARQLGQVTTLQLRYTRVVLNLQLRAALNSDLGYGLALESLAALDAAADGRPGPHA